MFKDIKPLKINVQDQSAQLIGTTSIPFKPLVKSSNTWVVNDIITLKNTEGKDSRHEIYLQALFHPEGMPQYTIPTYPELKMDIA